jgi:hypothetical protein
MTSEYATCPRCGEEFRHESTPVEVAEFLIFIHSDKDGDPCGADVQEVDGHVNLDWLQEIFGDGPEGGQGLLFIACAVGDDRRPPLDCWRWWRIVPAWDDGRADIESVALPMRGRREEPDIERRHGPASTAPDTSE